MCLASSAGSLKFVRICSNLLGFNRKNPTFVYESELCLKSIYESGLLCKKKLHLPVSLSDPFMRPGWDGTPGTSPSGTDWGTNQARLGSLCRLSGWLGTIGRLCEKNGKKVKFGLFGIEIKEHLKVCCFRVF